MVPLHRRLHLRHLSNHNRHARLDRPSHRSQLASRQPVERNVSARVPLFLEPRALAR